MRCAKVVTFKECPIENLLERRGCVFGKFGRTLQKIKDVMFIEEDEDCISFVKRLEERICILWDFEEPSGSYFVLGMTVKRRGHFEEISIDHMLANGPAALEWLQLESTELKVSFHRRTPSMFVKGNQQRSNLEDFDGTMTVDCQLWQNYRIKILRTHVPRNAAGRSVEDVVNEEVETHVEASASIEKRPYYGKTPSYIWEATASDDKIALYSSMETIPPSMKRGKILERPSEKPGCIMQ